MDWYDDLCEYYKVSPEEADILGTRKTGRKPHFPGSDTCKPVSGMNMEEYWDSRSRNTLQEKMDFYKDIGSWLSFRQCKYRSTFNYKNMFFPYLKNKCSVVEYGCGVAPLTNFIVENYKKSDINNMTFHLVDVVSEPLDFAKWRFKKKNPNLKIVFHEITENYPVPVFDISFDIICAMDVFEHLPNPLDVMKNLTKHSKTGTFFSETWRGGDANRCNLQEAENQRSETMSFIKKYYDIIKSGSNRCYIRNDVLFLNWSTP